MAKSTKTPKATKAPKTTLAQKIQAKKTGIPLEKYLKKYVKQCTDKLLGYIEREANPDTNGCSVEMSWFLTTDGKFYTEEITQLVIGEKKSWCYLKEKERLQVGAVVAYFNPRRAEILEQIKAGLIAEGFGANVRAVPIKNYRYDNGIQGYELTAEVTW